MRIAYVEDNPTNLALVERIVRMTNHTIVSYTEGEVALEALKREAFDLILMDVELAGVLNGLDVVRQLRGHGLRTPIVAVTAYAMMGDRDKCLAAGCDDYLPKPLPITDFISLLGRYDILYKERNLRPTSEVPAVVQPPPVAPAASAAEPVTAPVPSTAAQPPVPTVPPAAAHAVPAPVEAVPVVPAPLATTASVAHVVSEPPAAVPTAPPESGPAVPPPASPPAHLPEPIVVASVVPSDGIERPTEKRDPPSDMSGGGPTPVIAPTPPSAAEVKKPTESGSSALHGA